MKLNIKAELDGREYDQKVCRLFDNLIRYVFTGRQNCLKTRQDIVEYFYENICPLLKVDFFLVDETSILDQEEGIVRFVVKRRYN